MAVNVVPLEKQGEDERRAIHEAMVSGNTRVTCLTIVGAVAPLGNHYHPLPERFLLVQGSARLWTRALDAEGHPVEKVQDQDIEGPCWFEIPACTAHTLMFKGPAVLVSFNEGEFKREDLIKHKLA